MPQDISLERDARGRDDARARRISRIGVPLVAGLLVIIAVVNVLIGLNRPSIPDEIEGLIFYSDVPNGVVGGPVDYDSVPPAGGLHAATTLECGIYFDPIANEKAVAALATGAVWIAYDPALSETEVDNLKLFAEGELNIFMSPYPDMPSAIVLTAWGVQLYPDSPNDTRIASFIRDYTNGAQAPASQLDCLDGVVVP